MSSPRRPNVVVIMTDTQNQDMVGAYGNPHAGTPALDRLASEGVRFERAYTSCPLCTPARGGLFTGMYPAVNGASYNGASPHEHVPHAGHRFRAAGYRTAYTGKWHLDGDYPYLGSGAPAPGFEPEWWYDGQCYRRDVGEAMYQMCYNGKDLAQRSTIMPEDPSFYWGHRVADRAIDFLAQAGDDPFFLAVSFDEPHGPYCAPPSWYRGVDPETIPVPRTWNTLGTGKPQMQQMAADHHGYHNRADLLDYLRHYHGCNRFVDHQIGRVLAAVRAHDPDNTIVVYTTDHGNSIADHRLWGKGFWMYERATRIPLLISGPGFARGVATRSLAGHVDILPTLLTACGIPSENPLRGSFPVDGDPQTIRDRNPWIERLQGVDLGPTLRDPAVSAREAAFISFHRFGNMPKRGHMGNFYPVRSVVSGRWKLVINLFDTDELYDLEADPDELENRLHLPAARAERDRLHDLLLAHMDEITDPLRGFQWGHRPWRAVRFPFFAL